MCLTREYLMNMIDALKLITISQGSLQSLDLGSTLG